MNGAFQPFCRLCTPENTVPAKPDAAFFCCDTAKESLGKGTEKKGEEKKAAVALRLCQRSRWKVCLRSTQREIYFVSSCEKVPALALHELGGSWKHRSTNLPTHLPTHLSIHDYLKPLSKCCGLGFEPAILQLPGSLELAAPSSCLKLQPAAGGEISSARSSRGMRGSALGTRDEGGVKAVVSGSSADIPMGINSNSQIYGLPAMAFVFPINLC